MLISRAILYICLKGLSRECLLLKQNLTFLSKSSVNEPPFFGPPMRCQWRGMVHSQRHWSVHSFIHSFTSESLVMELPHETGGKQVVTIHRSSVWNGVQPVPKGIVYDTPITTPVPCSLQHHTSTLVCVDQSRLRQCVSE
jgi:hypothetical protein